MRFRRMAWLALGISMVGCGGSSPPPPSIAIATASEGLPPPPPPAPAVVGLPSGAVLSGSIDTGVFARLAPMKVLELPMDGVMSLLARFTPVLDPSRPITFALAGASPAARRTIEALRPLIPANNPGDSSQPLTADQVQQVRDAVAGEPPTVALRALVPARDAEALHRMIVKALEELGFRSDGSAWTHGQRHVVTRVNGDGVVVDMAIGKQGRAALRELSTSDGRGEAPALSGRALRVRYSPAGVADLGFLHGVATTVAALEGAPITPDQRGLLAAQGMWESARSHVLAGSAKGNYFDTVDVSAGEAAGKMDITLTVDTGAAFPMPPDEVWLPSKSMTVPGASASVDIAEAFSQAWGFPGDQPRREGGSMLVNRVREAGWSGYLVALPWLVSEVPRIRLSQRLRMLGDRPKGSATFARFGSVSLSEGHLFFGVLPEKTSRAAAECALAEKTPCSAPHKLKLGGVTAIGHQSARLLQAEGRFVVVVVDDPHLLPAAIQLHDIGPARVELSLPALLKREHLNITGATIPDRLVGSIERSGRSIVLKLATP
ncbi:Hypothetical protein A7982_03772 [Minicystis rosea]|nr:Hypothetical protein A7982_03772 [Minicystis rosea]